MKFDWEQIDEETNGNVSIYTYRAKVFGGWVLRVEMLIDCEKSENFEGWSNSHNSLTFIPDPKHEWGKNVMENNT